MPLDQSLFLDSIQAILQYKQVRFFLYGTCSFIMFPSLLFCYLAWHLFSIEFILYISLLKVLGRSLSIKERVAYLQTQSVIRDESLSNFADVLQGNLFSILVICLLWQGSPTIRLIQIVPSLFCPCFSILVSQVRPRPCSWLNLQELSWLLQMQASNVMFLPLLQALCFWEGSVFFGVGYCQVLNIWASAQQGDMVFRIQWVFMIDFLSLMRLMQEDSSFY